jgi:hypothetical protein
MHSDQHFQIDQLILLEKYPGKGGWTYAIIPGISPDTGKPFGWREVSGFIDEVEIRNYKLMPLKGGQLFLPVKAEIRKKIRKEAGDWVHIKLSADITSNVVPEEFLLCLKDDDVAWNNFHRFSEEEKRKYIDWIFSVKSDNLKIERMADAINRISRGIRL